ncbi:MAG: hypothetical protein KDA84_26840, partial [Planctomycetaceae bacterium]|nr:hypothetical protein [Planctomycetaceae bacterium]
FVVELPMLPSVQNHSKRFGALFAQGEVYEELVAEEQRVRKRFGTPQPFNHESEISSSGIGRNPWDSSTQSMVPFEQIRAKRQRPQSPQAILHPRRQPKIPPPLPKTLDVVRYYIGKRKNTKFIKTGPAESAHALGNVMIDL